MRAEERGRHGGALDVPAGATRSPRRLPAGFARLGVLPQDEVERIALALIDLHARPGAQLREALAGEAAVVGEAGDRVQHIAVRRAVGVAALEQLSHHGDDLRQELRGAWLLIGGGDLQLPAVLVHRVDEALRERAERLAVLRGAANDLV